MISTLQHVFTTVLNLSLTGSVAVLVVLALRPLLTRAPKAVTWALWLAPLFRLVCPVSFQSAFSLFALLGGHGAPQPVPMDIGLMHEPRVDLFVPALSDAVSRSLPVPAPIASINPMQIWMMLGALVWTAGVLAMALWGVVSYGRLKWLLRTAIRGTDGLWCTEHPGAPFVCGLLRPRVYVSADLACQPMDHILRHERAHIRYGDPWVKALWYAALCAHWFNPLAWVAFRLVARDMELRADEAALRNLGEYERAADAETLLNLCRPRQTLRAPLAFGESDAGSRIRRALNHRRPAFWVMAAAVVLVAAAAVALIANPFEQKRSAGTLSDVDRAAKLYEQRTPYVGDNSKVGAILNLLPWPKGVQLDSFELQTREQPYGVTARFSTTLGSYDGQIDAQLRFRHCAAMLQALVGNADVTQFEVRLDGKTRQYSYALGSLAADYPLIETIRGEQDGLSDFATLAMSRLTTAAASFTIRRATSEDSEGFAYTVRPGQRGFDLMSTLLNAYTEAGDSPRALGGTGGLYISYFYDKTSISTMNLTLRRDDQGRAWAQMDDGPVRAVDAKLYGQLDDLLAGQATTPLETPQVTATPAAQAAIRPPDFVYSGDDPLLQLVYPDVTRHFKHVYPDPTMVIAAVHVHGSYDEGDRRKVLATVWIEEYAYDDVSLTATHGGGVVPVAITYQQTDKDVWTMLDFTEAQDGRSWTPSIRDYCTLPVSGKTIPGLADKIMQYYTDRDDLQQLIEENKQEYCRVNGLDSLPDTWPDGSPVT